MRYRDSIFGQLLKPLSRRCVASSAAVHRAEAYDKSFRCWDHLVAMIFAQLADTGSLRELEAAWNANAHQHYHLGSKRLARTTLADANRRRAPAVFADVFARLSGEADRVLRREGAEVVRIIDSSPIPLGKMIACRAWNGRIKGAKLHVVFEPGAGRPCHVEITPANVNDIEFGKAAHIEKGMTYVFDKGYCSYAWWTKLHENGAFFVTRMKGNARYRTVKKRPLRAADREHGGGFSVLEDGDVKIVSKSNAVLGIPVRRIRIKRESGGHLVLITNDLSRSATEIAALYKSRWQIELLFRWVKQNLNLKTFLGRSENAIKLQILAAMIAYLLLRIAARMSACTHTPIRFAELVGRNLFVRKPLAKIDKPPEVNPSLPKPKPFTGQLELRYA